MLEPGSWVRWWVNLSLLQKALPAVLFASYVSTLWSIGGLRPDLVVFSLLPAVVFYGGPKCRALFQFLLPLCLTALLYDSQRYFADSIRGPIHVREPYEWDKRLFGISTSKGVLTPNEWLQQRTHPVLDLVTGLAYIVYVPVYVLVAAYFRFWKSGTARLGADALHERSSQITWSFLWVNLLGWSTYYWYAASPPWYVAEYGFGPARLDVAANPAGCARFDHLTGLGVFSSWYGRAADVHGAIPALHVSYPLMSFYYAMRFGAARGVTFAYFLLMCFSALYLNHHYVGDVVWGSLYGVTVAAITDGVWTRGREPSVSAP